jgi:RNA polymerase sigma factor (sigma-70 family)
MNVASPAQPVPLPHGPETKMDVGMLIRQAQAGSSEACQALFDRCREPLLAAIRFVIRPRLRRLYDSDDFLNETFIEIFAFYFTDDVLRSPERLWRYLKRIAENKVRDATRKYLLSQRYGIGRDVSLANVQAEEVEECLWSHELSPDEALLLKELVDERLTYLVSQLPTMLQQIIRLLLDGAGTKEIAGQLRVEPKRIYRAMEWLRKRIRE